MVIYLLSCKMRLCSPSKENTLYANIQILWLEGWILTQRIGLNYPKLEFFTILLSKTKSSKIPFSSIDLR